MDWLHCLMEGGDLKSPQQGKFTEEEDQILLEVRAMKGEVSSSIGINRADLGCWETGNCLESRFGGHEAQPFYYLLAETVR